MRAITKFCLIFSCIFGLGNVLASETVPFFLPREDGSVLEGYFLPPEEGFPIVFAIQGSSCQSFLKWHEELSNQVKSLGLGLIVLEKQGISENKINLVEYNQNNSLQKRYEDYILCLDNLPAISPKGSGKVVFLGFSEGGMLAAHLASQVPETVAVLLFATGGGMKPREEAKWAIQNRLEKHGALQEEINEYMSCLDEQLDLMVFDPTPDKEFLGNTYQWWASLLSENEISKLLSAKPLPVYLVHGVSDDKIPVLSADIAADLLEKTNTLTYLRLENYGHNLDDSNIYSAACSWLKSVLDGQGSVNVAEVIRADSYSSSVSEDWKTAISEYVISRGGGEISVGAGGSKDTEGNQKASASLNVTKEMDNGSYVQGRATASANQDNEGKTKGEVSFEVSWNSPF